jgi:hypothetical protein
MRMCDEASSRIQKTIPLVVPDDGQHQMATKSSEILDLRGLPFDSLPELTGNAEIDGFAPYDPILGFVPNFFADFDVISGSFQN